jgi:hypothetical protein
MHEQAADPRLIKLDPGGRPRHFGAGSDGISAASASPKSPPSAPPTRWPKTAPVVMLPAPRHQHAPTFRSSASIGLHSTYGLDADPIPRCQRGPHALSASTGARSRRCGS